MSFKCWFELIRYVRREALYAYVVAHHEVADYCRWPRDE